MTIVTPSDPKRRGAQLSLQFSFPVKEVHHQLASRGVVVSTYVCQQFGVWVTLLGYGQGVVCQKIDAILFQL